MKSKIKRSFDTYYFLVYKAYKKKGFGFFLRKIIPCRWFRLVKLIPAYDCLQTSNILRFS